MVTITERFRNDTTTVYSEDAELVWERIFDAPRDVVWQAFMDPERIPLWWGPHGSTATVVEMDVRPGGSWRYVNSAPDREEQAFYGTYLEVTPTDGFRWTFMFDVEGMGSMGGPETFTFEDLGSSTRVTSIGHMGSVEAIEGALGSGMVAGGIQAWDRLAALLAAS